jgi:hypothetical protein
MKIRFLFGYLCFLLSVALCAFQFATLPTAHTLPVPRLIFLCIVTVIFLVIGFLSFESPREQHLTFIVGLAFLICAAALVCVAAFAIVGPAHMAAIKYVVFLLYAFLYGAFGLALSFLIQSRSASKRA